MLVVDWNEACQIEHRIIYKHGVVIISRTGIVDIFFLGYDKNQTNSKLEASIMLEFLWLLGYHW